jgi:hypothetical protein
VVGVDIARQNHCCVGEIEGWCCDVEDSDNSEGRSDSNEIESDGKENDKPDGVDWRLRIGVDL